ncbi:hypothetical protein DL240_09040 [Lujinxingia litoralis]|uniref:DUF3137 domain-containing protein n=1 Tax=Lujinxingia litoralis TaxID=2211119 RepID=A0A328CB73_9DELT|nr:hypothetical protein [Lujinxingia litoralis]RAL23023.1 hypothetical protein DL240_09040 [Lujinxingia litoralis]
MDQTWMIMGGSLVALVVLFHIVFLVPPVISGIRLDRRWEEIRQARGWPAGKSHFFGAVWMVDTRIGPIHFQMGYKDFANEMDLLVTVMVFDAPFPRTLHVSRRRSWDEEAPDLRFGGADSEFNRLFKVKVSDDEPGLTGLACPAFGALLAEFGRGDSSLELKERRLQIKFCGATRYERQGIEAQIEQYLQAARSIVEMAGLQGGEGPPEAPEAGERHKVGACAAETGEGVTQHQDMPSGHW